jgi:hypothetical protein
MIGDAEPASDHGNDEPFTIDDGLPASHANWPVGVLEALRPFAQGHVVANPPLFYYADPSRPIWARTAAYTADATGPEIVEAGDQTAPRYGLITSQTCDISEEDAERPIRPWVQVAPIYNRTDLNSGAQTLLRNGKGPRHLLHLPALPQGFWVADLRIEVPVEKGWLATSKPIDGFGDETKQRAVGERVALLRSRPAFAGRFVDAVQRPLVAALKNLRATDRALYDRMDVQVDEVCVQLDSLLDPSQARVVLLCETDPDPDVREWWEQWWDRAVPTANAAGINLHAFAVRLLSEMTVTEYRRMTTVPLTRLSPD